mgnify:FL=1
MNGRRPAGFTLIEVVAAIVLSAIAMAAILPFLSNVFLRSYEPRTQMDEGLALQTAMENLVVWHSSNSGLAGTNSLERLRQYVATNLPAGIVALETNYVDFAGSAETASTNPVLLKVTLANGFNEAVTRLFARPLKEVP